SHSEDYWKTYKRVLKLVRTIQSKEATDSRRRNFSKLLLSIILPFGDRDDEEESDSLEEIVDDLERCYQGLLEGKAPKKNEPEAIVVLVDFLLSLLPHPSSLL